jgi:hypothetical protein
MSTITVTTTHKHELSVPSVHWNGTSKSALLMMHVNAIRALRDAEKALCQMSPHGRDYYPLAEGALTKAIHQHVCRIEKLGEIIGELEAIAQAIDKQEACGR